MNNEFVPIPFCPQYEINKEGNIRRIATGHIRKLHLVKNYYSISLRQDNKLKQYRIHRLVAMVFIPNLENKPCVNHKDGNKLNNHVDNLEWCTSSENTYHAFRLGLMDVKGEKHPSAKLTDSAIREIRLLLKAGWSHSQIGKKFKVAKQTISNVVWENTWKHVK